MWFFPLLLLSQFKLFYSLTVSLYNICSYVIDEVFSSYLKIKKPTKPIIVKFPSSPCTVYFLQVLFVCLFVLANPCFFNAWQSLLLCVCEALKLESFVCNANCTSRTVNSDAL